jgi:glutamine amidotransferase
MIGVIDYKAGNGPSVINALNKINAKAMFVSNPEMMLKMNALILPGVGSAEATMTSLKDLNCIEALKEFVLQHNKPFLGICVGLQVLFEKSEEGNAECLGFLKGNVKKFSAEKVRVPQMGWNKAKFLVEHPILEGLNEEEYFYFVNSYYVVPEDSSIILSTTDYCGEFCSMIYSNNIYAAQFHIEKSGEAGLTMLRNFVEMAEKSSREEKK